MLHEESSSNPAGVLTYDKVRFFPYFALKDLQGYVILLLVLYWALAWYPESIKEEQKYINANPLVTPEHIQPEWYFLSAYAVLRAVPNKLGGVISLGLYVIVFYFLVFIKTLSFNKIKNEHTCLTYLWFVKVVFLT
jgi:ubiquinol-cytochrome c reductase cytochrome b subunit